MRTERFISPVAPVWLCLVLCSSSGLCQTAPNAAADSPVNKPAKANTLVLYGGTALVGPRAFSKMTSDMYGYALSGSNNPSSGIKVTTTSPSASYTGTVVIDPFDILTYTLSAQSLDNVTQLFSNNKVNSSFKFSMGYNVQLPSGSHAKYDPRNTQKISRRQRSFNIERRKVYVVLDSAIIIQHMLNDQLTDTQTLLDSVVQHILRLTRQAAGQDTAYARYRKFYKNPANHYVDLYDANDLLDYIKPKLSALLHHALYNAPDSTKKDLETNFKEYKAQFRNEYNKKLGDIYNRIKNIAETTKTGDPKTLIGKIDDIEIDGTSEFWTRRIVNWCNFTFSGVNNAVTFYDTSVKTYSKRLIDTNALLFSGGISFNRLTKFASPNAFNYLTIGVMINGISTIDDIAKTKFNYTKNTLVDSSTGSNVMSTKTGTAYRGNLHTATGLEFYAEMYIRPWTSNITPGVYARFEADYGQIWINHLVLSPTIGPIINITNSDKTASKNYLTIIPYVSMTNLLTTYNNAAHLSSQVITPGTKVVVGLKVGVPIYF